MAGHSKWSQIKRQKAVVDAKRGVVFTRLAREISVAARAGADPAGNFQLRTALEKARAAGLPNNNIERAIAKGSGQGSGDGDQFQEVRYEGYGPGGVAVLVEALTDNRNRTAADLRLAFSKHGGNLGEVGSVGYLFEHRGVVRIEQPQLKENALLESLLAVELAGGPAALTYTFEPAATGWPRPARAGLRLLEVAVVLVLLLKKKALPPKWCAALPTWRHFKTPCAIRAGACRAGNTAGSPPPPAAWRSARRCATACACSMPSTTSMTFAA